jgi:hypothetical protein
LWALAVTLEVTTETDQEAIFWACVEDGWNIYLDGEQLAFGQRVQAPIYESVQVPLRLTPGKHLLLVLVEDHGGAAAFSGRLTDAHGAAPAPGITVGLP